MSKCTCAFPCGGTTATCPSAPERPETVRQWFDRNRDSLDPETVASMERAFAFTGKQIETLGHRLIAAGGYLMFNSRRDLCQDEGCPQHGTDHVCLSIAERNTAATLATLECKHERMIPLFKHGEVVDYLCADCTYRMGGPTKTFTVFCQEDTGRGTIWFDAVDAASQESASEIGLARCADEWKMDIGEVRVLGVAEGDVKILTWDDLE